MILLGNIIAFVASIIMIYSGVLKSKKKILYTQTLQIGLLVISDLVLGGITGAIINLISLIRNVLCYNGKLSIKSKLIISILSVILSVMFNNLGFIGLLPLISMIIYLWYMTIKDVKKFKLLLAFTIFLWLIYDLSIKSYALAIFDFVSVIANILTAYNIKLLNINKIKRKKNNK